MNDAYELLKGYVPVKSALKTRPEGDMLIAANNNAEIYYLNDMAGEIWGILDGTASIDRISRQILSEYDVQPDEVHADVVKFIRDMQWKRLIRLKKGDSLHEGI